jgi:predicted kinase
VLIIFGGLSGTGKTTIARELARQIGAMHLRIDSIEQAIRDGAPDAVGLDEAGYRVAYAVAEDNLRLGRTVVADSVNPLHITRGAWREVGRRAGAVAMEFEIVCSDLREHRNRVETRKTDITGLRAPSWDEVVSREYEPWDRERIVIDTAGRSVEQNVKSIREAIPQR